MSPRRNYAPHNVFVIRKSLRYRVSVTVNSTVPRAQCKINCKLSRRSRSDLYQHEHKLHVYRIRSTVYPRKVRISCLRIYTHESAASTRCSGDARTKRAARSRISLGPTRLQRVGERNSYLRSLRCDVENEIPLI